MKRIIVLFLFLVLTGIHLEAKAWVFRSKSPTTGQLETLSNEQFSNLAQMEVASFGLSFEGENVYNRVDRLEKRMINQVNSSMPLNERVSNLTGKSNPSQMYNIPLQDLAQIEYNVYNRSFTSDILEARLARLEGQMFGAVQSGNLASRYDLIRSASANYRNKNNYYNSNAYSLMTPQTTNYQSYFVPNTQPIFQNTNNTGWRNVLGNVLSTFAGGSMTGYTPSLYDPYGFNTNNGFNNSGFNNSGFQINGNGYNQRVWTPTGYRDVVTNTSTGAGVTILP